MNKRAIPAEALQNWIETILAKLGYSSIHASYVAENLTEANLCGYDSHGIMRLPIYVERIKSGLVVPQNCPVISYGSSRSVIKVNANACSGQVAMQYAVQALLKEKAQNPVAVCAVSNSAHFGISGHYSRLLAQQNCIGMVLSNAEACVAPYKRSHATLGTNPISLAVPGKRFPVCFDFSTSIVSFGKIFHRRNTNEKIPPHWGLDSDGYFSEDPHAITTLLPFGGADAQHKGFALSLFIDILSGVLSGAAFSTQIGNMYHDFSKKQNVGHFLLSIDIASIMPVNEFLDRLELFLELVFSAVSRNKDAEPFIPGQRSFETKKARLRNGIPLPAAVYSDLQELAECYSVPLPQRVQQHQS